MTSPPCVLANQHTPLIFHLSAPLQLQHSPSQQPAHLADLVHIVHQVLHGEHKQALPLLGGPAAPVALQHQILELSFTSRGRGVWALAAVTVCRAPELVVVGSLG